MHLPAVLRSLFRSPRKNVPLPALACLSLVACSSLLPAQQETVSAAKFVDTVGVNIHLHYQDSAYYDFPKVEAALKQLGVHHVRDGLVNSTWEQYYDGLIALGADGIHSLLITNVSETAPLLRVFPSRVPGSVEGIEAPNELDAAGGDWLKQVHEEQEQITGAMRGSNLFTVGASMTKSESFAQMGQQPCGCTFGNLHNYFGGRNPGTAGWGDDGYGSYAWSLKHARQAFGDRPIYSTETGYIADPAKQDGVPEEVAGKYTVRLLLEQFLHGIQRTYLYELVDTDIPERGVHDRYGLLRTDFTPRPAFTAVSALVKLLSDSDAPTATEAEASGADPIPVTWQLARTSQDLHHLALRKANGDTVLLLWLEVPIYDVDAKHPIAVHAEQTSLTLGDSTTPAAFHFMADGELKQVAVGGGKTLPLTVDDAVLAVVLPAKPRSAASRPARSHQPGLPHASGPR